MRHGLNSETARQACRYPAVRGGAFAFLVVMAGFMQAGPAYAGTAALVLDSGSGDILYSYRMDAPHHPASLTKMMTLYMAFEALRDGRLKPGQRLRVSRFAARQRPSRLGLRRGKTIRVEHAILALVTKSANDASVVIAEAVAGSEAAFAKRMTQRAQTLGMSRTVFRNASGLHHPGQTTTAGDMAKLATALIRDFPRRYSLFSTKVFRWRGRRHRNHNPLLSTYTGADGIKTGYIRQSGYNLVASAQRGDRRVIGIVLGGQTARIRDWMMETLLDYGFRRPGDEKTMAGLPGLPYLEAPSGEEALDITLKNAGTAVRTVRSHRHPRGVYEPVAPRRQSGKQSGAGENWAIQVGAYLDAPAAEEAAVIAADRIPALLGGARVLVMPVTRGGQRMYRARLAGLSEGQAHDSCRQLARHRIPCLAVASTGEFRISGVLR